MIYFDNAATTFPKPEKITEEVRRCMTEYCGNPGRGSHRMAAEAAEKLYECRCEVADFLKCDCPQNIVFTQNATFALNLAIRTRVKTGMHILLSDQEHNAVLRPVLRLAEEKNVTYSIYSSYGNIKENIIREIRPETGMLICNPVSNVTGHEIPIDTVMTVAAKHHLYLIVDGSQWLGHSELPTGIGNIDALCAPGHKGLYGMQGSGFLYLRSADNLTTFLDGGSGSDSKNPQMPESLPERYEAGTVSTPAVVSLLEGIRFVRRIGLQTIGSSEKALVSRAYEMLSGISGFRIWTREDGGGSVLSFSHEKVHPDILCNELDRRRICARSGYHCAPLAHRSAGTDPRGTVRISFSIFNSSLEVDIFYKELCDIMRLL